jgi:hypothetical protein
MYLVGRVPVSNVLQPNLGQEVISTDDYLYVIDARLQILDIEDPYRMRVASNAWWITGAWPASASIDGQLLFTGGYAGLDRPACCVRIHDVADPLLPEFVYGTGTYGSALDVWPHDGQLAIADGRQGLTLFRLTTPTPPGASTATPTAPITPPPDATATPTLGIRVLPATPEFTPYPFPTPRPATPAPSLRQQIFVPLAQRAATG